MEMALSPGCWMGSLGGQQSQREEGRAEPWGSPQRRRGPRGGPKETRRAAVEEAQGECCQGPAALRCR